MDQFSVVEQETIIENVNLASNRDLYRGTIARIYWL